MKTNYYYLDIIQRKYWWKFMFDIGNKKKNLWNSALTCVLFPGDFVHIGLLSEQPEDDPETHWKN